jgi:DNA-binding NarL/FixJ family response regulator
VRCGDSARLDPVPGRRVRVLLVHHQPVFAESLRLQLSEDDRIDVVGLARDGKEAIELAESLQPDVVLMDIAIPVIDGVEATRRMRAVAPGSHVLILTGVECGEDMVRARDAGASGFVRKNQPAAELTEAISQISALARAFAPDRERHINAGN